MEMPMKQKLNNLKLTKTQKQILLIFVFFAILIGFLLYKKIDSSVFVDELENLSVQLENAHVNFLFLHFLVLTVLISTSLLVFGLVFFVLYFLWEAICMVYSTLIFANIYGISGFIYGVVYNFVLKFVFLVCLFVIFWKLASLVKAHFLKKELGDSFKKQYRMILVGIFVLFLYDVLLYFFGNDLLLKLTFILS